MSFWDRAGKALAVLRGAEQKTDPLDLFRELSIPWGSQTWAGKDVSLVTAMQVSPAIACGRVIAEGIAMFPWKVVQATGSMMAPVANHPLYDKLSSSPNRLQTAFEFQETMGLHLAFCGNAYVWVTRNRFKQIDELLILDPSWVLIKHRWPEEPEYEVRIEGKTRYTLTASEVWHVRGPSWTTYRGLEFIKLARQALGLSMAIEEGQAKLQAQGVNIPGVVSVDGVLNEEQYKKLRKWLEQEHEGSNNAGRAMILDRAAKWTATGMSNVDAQISELRRQQVEEVCRFMRVLPIMVGFSDKTASYASSEQMFLAHAMYTLGPWARRLEQSANKALLSPEDRAKGIYTKLNEKALLRMSSLDQMNYLKGLSSFGIMTRNEARAVLDLNPLDGLDDPLTPVNTVAGDPPEVDTTPATPPVPPPNSMDEPNAN